MYRTDGLLPLWGRRGGVMVKDQNGGLGWVAGSRVKDEGRGEGGDIWVRDEEEGQVGSLGQVVPESDSIEISGEKVPSFSFLLGISPGQETLLLMCLEQLSSIC